jgi:hypothetical protein
MRLKIHIGLNVKYMLLLSYLYDTLIFFNGFRRITQNQISWISVPGARGGLRRTGGKADRRTEKHCGFKALS